MPPRGGPLREKPAGSLRPRRNARHPIPSGGRTGRKAEGHCCTFFLKATRTSRRLRYGRPGVGGAPVQLLPLPTHPKARRRPQSAPRAKLRRAGGAGCSGDEKGAELTNETETREYRAGDEVILEFTVDDEFELGSEVAAVFEHEGGETAGRVTRTEENVIELKTSGRRGGRQFSSWTSVPPGKSSAVELRGRVTAANALGEYRLARVEAAYRGGRRIRFDLEGTDARLRVVEDPVAGPRITRISLR